MLVTKTEEIKAYLPTAVYSDPTALLALTQDAEETYILPVLGRSLYEHVCEQYETITSGGGLVTPSGAPGNTGGEPIEKLIRLCQMPTVYFALSNSAGILSVSLNGAGMNRMSTDGYDAADDKTVARFTKDTFMKAHRGIDRLLLFLEEDAKKAEPEFAELWKESTYFYAQGDLLFTTATVMERYLDLGGSRERFITLLPDIRYCQDVYLAPRVGDRLIEAMVQWSTDPKVLETGNGNLPEKVWRTALSSLRMALSRFVGSRREKAGSYMENDAMMSLARAAEYIAANQEAFGPYIQDSPLYKPVPPATEAPSDSKPVFDFDNPDNALFCFGRNGLNKH